MTSIDNSSTPGEFAVDHKPVAWQPIPLFGTRFEDFIARYLWATLTIPLVLVLGFGYWIVKHDEEGSITIILRDPYMSTLLIALLLSSISFCIWQMTIRETLGTAIETGLISQEPKEIEAFSSHLQRFASMISNPLRFIPSSILVLITVISTLVSINWQWPGVVIVFRLAIVLFFGVASYSIGMIAWTLLSSARMFASLSRNEVLNIQPGHSDGCCGLESIGNCCLQSVVPLLIGMVLCLLWSNSRNLPFFTNRYDESYFSKIVPLAEGGLVFFFLLACALVFLPVRDLHKRLKKFKENQDREFSKALTTALQHIPSTLATNDVDRIKMLADRLKIVQTMDPAVLKISTWPFDKASLFKYGLTPVASLSVTLGKVALKAMGFSV